MQQIACHPTADGGCGVLCWSTTTSANLIENVTAQVTLIGADGQSIASKSAVLPLDILPPDQSLPLAVFFPPGDARRGASAGADSDRDAAAAE